MAVLLILAALLGIIPGLIASNKGRNFGLWWFYGFMLFIVALIHSLVIEPTGEAAEQKKLADGMVRCPQCAEFIHGAAKLCRHCKSPVELPSA